jgi:hypothetical protein
MKTSLAMFINLATKWTKGGYSNLDKCCNRVWLPSIHCTNKTWSTKTFPSEIFFCVFSQDIWHSILGCYNHSVGCFHKDWSGWRPTSQDFKHQMHMPSGSNLHRIGHIESKNWTRQFEYRRCMQSTTILRWCMDGMCSYPS